MQCVYTIIISFRIEYLYNKQNGDTASKTKNYTTNYEYQSVPVTVLNCKENLANIFIRIKCIEFDIYNCNRSTRAYYLDGWH